MATDPGYRDMIHMLSKGGAVFYYGDDPEAMIQAIGLYRIEGMIVSPQGLAEYLKFYEAYPNLPCGLDHILTSGASLSRALSDRVRARMCSRLFSTLAQPRPAALLSRRMPMPVFRRGGLCRSGATVNRGRRRQGAAAWSGGFGAHRTAVTGCR